MARAAAAGSVEQKVAVCVAFTLRSSSHKEHEQPAAAALCRSGQRRCFLHASPKRSNARLAQAQQLTPSYSASPCRPQKTVCRHLERELGRSGAFKNNIDVQYLCC